MEEDAKQAQSGVVTMFERLKVIYLSTYLSIYIFIYLSIYLSIYIFITHYKYLITL